MDAILRIPPQVIESKAPTSGSNFISSNMSGGG